MKIAVEGCAHGELEQIYAAIKEAEQRDGTKIDLLICCGDFQSARNNEDLACMAVPPKYRKICSFYKYYSGELQAPILTIFIGGNHEASNYLQELPYGGWVAPNIYYMGYAGVINIGGLRIGGLSGIYKSHDYMKGRFECVPYDEQTKRSVYHVRNLDVFRFKQLTSDLDIFLSHDWPNGVYNFGDKEELLEKKPFFRDEISTNQLGSKPCEELLNHLQPSYWFSAHLHVKFPALIEHESGKKTRFLALDKCLPRRQFLQILDIPTDPHSSPLVQYDLEWLAILHLTDHLISVKSTTNFMPGPGGDERYQFTPTDLDVSFIRQKLQDNLTPPNFTATAQAYPQSMPSSEVRVNPQTKDLCEKLHITDPLTLINGSGISEVTMEKNVGNVTFLDSEDEEQEEGRKLTPLSLPMPKSSMEDVEPETDETCVTLPTEALEVDVSTEEKNVSPKRDVIEEDVGVKKFKRRNASVYSNDCT